MMAGGFSEEKGATETVQKLCDRVRDEAELRNGMKFSMFTVKSYKTQVVCGTNYIVKVQTDDESYIHLKIFEPLPVHGDKPTLDKMETNKQQKDILAIFH